MPTKNISKHKYKLLAVSYTIWLTTISLTPLDGFNLPSFSYADKIVHFFLYFFLTVFWIKAYPGLWNRKLAFIILVILWGVIIEFLQETFVPGRHGDVFDALANTTGGIVALLFYHYVARSG